MNLVDHISAFTNMFGAQNPDIVFPLATVNWNSTDERDKFLNELLYLNDNQRIGE